MKYDQLHLRIPVSVMNFPGNFGNFCRFRSEFLRFFSFRVQLVKFLIQRFSLLCYLFSKMQNRKAFHKAKSFNNAQISTTLCCKTFFSLPFYVMGHRLVLMAAALQHCDALTLGHFFLTSFSSLVFSGCRITIVVLTL